LPQFGLPEDLIRGAAAGPAAGVGAFGVVVAEIALQVEPQPGLLGDEVAGEGRLPALIQDGLLEPLDDAVELLWSSGQVGGLGAGDQGLEDDVGQPPLEAPQGFALGLALGLLAVQVGDCSRLPGGLGKGHIMQGTVEPAVAASIETVAVGPAGGDRDRGGAVGGGEMVSVREAGHLPDLAQDPGGQDGTNADQVDQPGAAGRDQRGQLAGELTDLTRPNLNGSGCWSGRF
jgi:hypothetical protein